MRTLDRLLRIIYKEADLFRYINEDTDDFEGRLNFKLKECFNLNSNYFRKILKQVYLSVYPNNYNEDEIELFIIETYSKLKGRYTKYQDSNTANLFLYIVQELLFLRGGDICISFDDLLEWNGFINKIDANILIAAKLAQVSDFYHFDHHRIEYDNERLLRILSSGMSENHMHLKASGYSTEMNWYEFSNSNEVTLYEFERLMYDRRILINPKEIISFYKIRYIKAYLFSKLSEKKYISYKQYEYVKLSTSFMRELLSDTDLERYEWLFIKNEDRLFFWQSEFEKTYCGNLDEDTKYFLSERLFLKDLFLNLCKNQMDDFSLYLFNVYLLASSKFKMFFCQDNEAMGFEKL